MNKIIATLLLVIFPATLYASETPKVSPLNKGDRAPFAGVLFNPAAVAQAIVDKKAVEEECKLERNLLEDKLSARCDLLLQNLEADIKAWRHKYYYTIEIKDKEIKRLQDFALNKPKDHSHWWFSGGIIIGVILVGSVVYISK